MAIGFFTPPPGYRQLGQDEVIQKGDLQALGYTMIEVDERGIGAYAGVSSLLIYRKIFPGEDYELVPTGEVIKHGYQRLVIESNEEIWPYVAEGYVGLVAAQTSTYIRPKTPPGYEIVPHGQKVEKGDMWLAANGRWTEAALESELVTTAYHHAVRKADKQQRESYAGWGDF